MNGKATINNASGLSGPEQPLAGAADFYQISEPYAGGFYESPSRSRFFRFARAQRRFWEQMTLPAYDGGRLYPCGSKYPANLAVCPDFSFTFSVNWSLLDEKNPLAASMMREETALLPPMQTPHTVGGSGYTHAIPNYARVLLEGLDAYRERVLQLPAGDFADGLLEILDGIHAYQHRALDLLHASDAPEQLIRALNRVPFQPARDFYEALVGWNFLYYVDGCDNPGRMDTDLAPFYRDEPAVALLREFFRHVDDNNGWSAALGPDFNSLTLQCLQAIKGLRRPSLELRVTPQTSGEIWTAAADALLSGCGQPAFYNEEAYQSALASKFPHIPAADLRQFNGGGCTETMLAGISHVGSLDAGLNLPLIFSAWLRSHLNEAEDFSDFYQGLLAEIRRTTADLLDQVIAYRRRQAEVRPQPVRTLLIDDCIDRGLDFHGGGARYSWSVVNVAGLINVVDALLALRTLVYERQIYTPAAFLSALDSADVSFQSQLRACPCFGVDDTDADQLANEFATAVFTAFDQRIPFGGGAFLPSSIQFATYADAGKGIPATPDGREADAPLADSIGAIHGKDRQGPTALLNSAARLPQSLALGTPVLNLRLQKSALQQTLRPLIEAYFKQGGLQVQVSYFSRDDLLDALAHPDKHEHLIVRIGGYAEYFNRLTPELKQTVLARTEHS